jgi:ATP-dependent RNA helicase RhlE
VRVEASAPATTVSTIEQRVILAHSKQKRDELNKLLADPALERVIVFARTKHGADKVAKNLALDGHDAAAIHGNKSQNARQAALKGFSSGRTRILVATDIAARGIDVPNITHVINYELPDDAENYVHRIGRTARNGASGIAITLCNGEERAKLREVERLIRRTLPVTGDLRDPGTEGGSAAPSQERPPRRNVGPAGKPRHNPPRNGNGERQHAPGGVTHRAGPHGEPANGANPKPRWTPSRKRAAKARRPEQTQSRARVSGV